MIMRCLIKGRTTGKLMTYFEPLQVEQKSVQLMRMRSVAFWLKLPFRFKILHPAHKRVFRVVGLGRSGSFRVALGS